MSTAGQNDTPLPERPRPIHLDVPPWLRANDVSTSRPATPGIDRFPWSPEPHADVSNGALTDRPPDSGPSASLPDLSAWAPPSTPPWPVAPPEPTPSFAVPPSPIAAQPTAGVWPVDVVGIDQLATSEAVSAPVNGGTRQPVPRPASAAGTAGGRAPSTLEAVDVSCWFGSHKVLERVSLLMAPGAITALIGPSGCGKSTFLRTLNRMHELIPGASLAGSIKLDGRDVYGADATPTQVRYQIGMVFQRPNPFPAMSIAGNVLAGLRLAGTRTNDADDLLESCLTRAGLWKEARDRLNSSGASLSGGQQQRLCIARALALHPKILLMDEPCSALDPISTRVIEETMLAIKDQVTIVIVTHNMQQAQRVSDTCALFLIDEENAPGRIVEYGPTDQVFSSPSDPRTLDYVSGRFG